MKKEKEKTPSRFINTPKTNAHGPGLNRIEWKPKRPLLQNKFLPADYFHVNKKKNRTTKCAAPQNTRSIQGVLQPFGPRQGRKKQEHRAPVHRQYRPKLFRGTFCEVPCEQTQQTRCAFWSIHGTIVYRTEGLQNGTPRTFTTTVRNETATWTVLRGSRRPNAPYHLVYPRKSRGSAPDLQHMAYHRLVQYGTPWIGTTAVRAGTASRTVFVRHAQHLPRKTQLCAIPRSAPTFHVTEHREPVQRQNGL